MSAKMGEDGKRSAKMGRVRKLGRMKKGVDGTRRG